MVGPGVDDGAHAFVTVSKAQRFALGAPGPVSACRRCNLIVAGWMALRLPDCNPRPEPAQ